MDKVKQIQENLMTELGLESLPMEKKQEVVIRLTEVVLEKIFLETLKKLKTDDQKNYRQMVKDRKSAEEIDGFAAEKIPNYEQMIMELIANFKEEMKN